MKAFFHLCPCSTLGTDRRHILWSDFQFSSKFITPSVRPENALKSDKWCDICLLKCESRPQKWGVKKKMIKNKSESGSERLISATLMCVCCCFFPKIKTGSNKWIISSETCRSLKPHLYRTEYTFLPSAYRSASTLSFYISVKRQTKLFKRINLCYL